MIEQFLNHIQRHNLCKTTDKILLAVSGGLDSMVMLHLFQSQGYHVSVAHCNFQLRGNESEADEAFVVSYCKKHSVKLHVQRLDTSAFAESHGISIQMAARTLRYEFFNRLIDEEGYYCIATAHHLNDQLETVLLNITRGTGIDGITGIPVKNENVIRPLLFATRDAIEAYARQHNILWREDSSNAASDYHRNAIRLKVLPELTELNPGLLDTFSNTHERLTGALDLVKYVLEEIKHKAVQIRDRKIFIKFQMLRDFIYPEVVLWEIIKPSGFNYEQCKQIVKDHQAGRVFHSSSHQLVINREEYIIEERLNLDFTDTMISVSDQNVTTLFGSLEFSMMIDNGFERRGASHTIALFDAEKIHFPLRWRKWRPGDHFQPLGMQGTKKVSDFLIDLKVAIPDKQKVTVLESAGKIIWVVGYRIDESVKVWDTTQNIMKIEYKPVL